MGKGLANPGGTFWSVVMILEHFGETAAAQSVMRAVEAVTANPAMHTGDLGGNATTRQVTDAACEVVSGFVVATVAEAEVEAEAEAA